MTDRPSLRSVLLATLIGALVISALTGICILVVGDFGDRQVKILLTTLSVAYFSVTALACAAVLERKRVAWLAVPGVVASAAGFACSQLLIWPEWDSEPMGKTMVTLVIFAFSFAQSCLLALPRLARRVQWVFVCALACIFLLAALLSAMIAFELDDELLLRAAGVLGILDAVATLAVPVLVKMGVAAPAVALPSAAEAPDRWHIELACPRCGRRGVYPAGSIRCLDCALEIRVSISPPGPEGPGKRFQFTLKTALLLFVLVSLPAGWIGARLNYLARQRAVVERLEGMGADVYYDFGNVSYVSFTMADPRRFDPSVMNDIAKLTNLQRLDLNGMPVKDEHLAALRGMRMVDLVLDGTQVTDGCVPHLETLTHLRTLQAAGTAISSEGVRRLEQRLPGVFIVGIGPPPAAPASP
ncbi:MAG TPA: hypothetical protein EYH34_15735 [Planctomycetes bacterium]|nr:hypothetical protein [Planctomycetota bacterium]